MNNYDESNYLGDKEIAYVDNNPLEWDYDKKVFKRVSVKNVKTITKVANISQKYQISLLNQDILGNGAFGTVRVCFKNS